MATTTYGSIPPRTTAYVGKKQKRPLPKKPLGFPKPKAKK
jgi:hypothetical protein